MNDKQKNPTREHGFDVLKAVATILIVFHHYQQEFNIRFSAGINFYGGRFYFGMMVELFFILSGFFMVRYISRIKSGAVSFGSFIRRRLLRFIPLVGIAAAAYTAFLYIYMVYMGHMDYAEHVPSLWGTVIDTLCIQSGGAFLNPYVNNPTWYISILLICCVWFYCLTAMAERLKINENYLYLAMVFLGAGINTYEIKLPFLNAAAARGYYTFFWGILLGRLVFPAVRKAGKTAVIGAACLVAGMTFLIARDNILVRNDIKYLMTYLYYPALLLLFSTSAAKRLFHAPVWGRLGQISFNVFVWHMPCLVLLRVIWDLTGLDLTLLHSFGAMAAFAAVICLVGTLSHYLLEKPAGRWLEKGGTDHV